MHLGRTQQCKSEVQRNILPVFISEINVGSTTIDVTLIISDNQHSGKTL